MDHNAKTETSMEFAQRPELFHIDVIIPFFQDRMQSHYLFIYIVRHENKAVSRHVKMWSKQQSSSGLRWSAHILLFPQSKFACLTSCAALSRYIQYQHWLQWMQPQWTDMLKRLPVWKLAGADNSMSTVWDFCLFVLRWWMLPSTLITN